MALVEMVMPKMGESVMEGTILNWLKKVGDKIEQDEPVLEVATDKVDTEIPATHAGILTEILAQVGEVVPIGKPIALIQTEGKAETSPTLPSHAEEKHKILAESMILDEPMTSENLAQLLTAPVEGRFYSPLVMSIAKEEGISSEELSRIVGTGKEGRVTKNDILKYVEAKKKSPQPSLPKQEPTVQKTPVVETVKPQVEVVKPVAPAASYSGNVDIIEMDRMRKMIAQRMVDSKRISPHVTSFVEADVTNIVNWKNAHAKLLKEREGVSLTYTPIFIMAVVKALKDYPLVNSSIDGDNIIVKKDINIGLAVALPSGNLIVPVIKNADQLNLLGLTKQVNDLAKRARENKLTPDELSGGTYTVSNIGSFGNVMGTPIILQPQVAILSLGTIQKKPAVIETEYGDVIAIRQMMFLSHSYDHRIIDGALGGSFVRRVADYLEKFDVKQSI
ncbi:dihydrolipoamide acetyltransferase family protein [Thermoflexibacter ruber]|uniref:Dihydrolipoamide acetyltransferase component of pyruvate dehydrogenase complex n=1 Tax=Thermoflexibacter ruber TaxID=1003 RepID=A0A1I2AFY7_9BACT|nr:dihydrolipoamide acetyltransferase family protein [Thermoflexibacter ruber]SFE42782.1 2-oxoglutarate dehydrogenase E2 component (dihydrolipoamide succinyltransferase) [Thermoflexibacter ruber]